MIGPSLSSGARLAGSVRRQPTLIVLAIRKAWNGPGCTAHAKA